MYWFDSTQRGDVCEVWKDLWSLGLIKKGKWESN